MTTPTEALITVLRDGPLLRMVLDNELSAPNDFSDSVWSNPLVLVVTTDTDVAPDRTLTADTLNVDIAGKYLVQDTTVLDNTDTYKVHYYVKKGTATRTRILGSLRGGVTVEGWLVIDWSTSTASIAASSGTVSLTEERDGWYLATVTLVNTASGNTTLRSQIYPAEVAGFTGTVIAWGGGAFNTISSKLFNIEMAQNISYPSISIHKVAQTRENTMADSGGAGVENTRIRVSIYDEDLSDCEEVSEGIRLALDAAGSAVFKAVQIFNLDQFNADSKLYQVIVDYSIWYRH